MLGDTEVRLRIDAPDVVCRPLIPDELCSCLGPDGLLLPCRPKLWCASGMGEMGCLDDVKPSLGVPAALERGRFPSLGDPSMLGRLSAVLGFDA
jgi:hypothetical protein